MDNTYTLYSLSVDPEAVVDGIIGIASSPTPLSVNDIAEIIDKSETYSRAVLKLSEQLDLVQSIGSGYVVASDIEEEARRMSPSQGSILIKKKLQRYEPFMSYISFINKGYDSERAAQSIQTLYEFDVDANLLRSQLDKLGQYADLLDMEGSVTTLVDSEGLSRSYIDDLDEALQSEAQARLFVHARLGEEIVAFADEETVEDLYEALQIHETVPDTAIVNAVSGAESFTRKIAVQYGSDEVDYSNASGLGQLGKAMRRDDLVLKRHLHAANYLGSMRNPGSHGTDLETNSQWNVEPEVALETILGSANYMRSLYWYVSEERQIL
jgi:hypothetical protein